MRSLPDILVSLVVLVLLAGCTPTPQNVQTSDALPPIYPDYCNVTIPKNIAPLNFLLRGEVEAVQVKAGDVTINVHGDEVTFDEGVWRQLLAEQIGRAHV